MKRGLLVLLTIWITVSGLFAQEIQNPEGVPNLIISELRWDAVTRYYYEVTNMEDTAIDLSPYGLFINGQNGTYEVDENGFLTWPNKQTWFDLTGRLGPK